MNNIISILKKITIFIVAVFSFIVSLSISLIIIEDFNNILIFILAFPLLLIIPESAIKITFSELYYE